MKTTEFGVQELSQEEMKKVDGGLVWYAAIAVGIAVGIALEIIRDWDNFKAGLSGHCES